jgi:tetratricopeptide (TPR) repeat protein
LALARYFVRGGRFAEALALLEQTDQSVPHAEFVAVLAELVYRRGGDAAACEAARKLIGRQIDVASESDPEVLFGIQSLAQLEGNFVEAETLCRRVLEKIPDSAMACNDLAYLLATREKRCDEALALIDRAIAAVGPLGWLQDTRATVLRVAGNAELAAATMQELLLEAGTPVRRFHLAQALRDCGRTHEARTALQGAIKAGLDEGGLHRLERDDFRILTKQLAPTEGT